MNRREALRTGIVATVALGGVNNLLADNHGSKEVKAGFNRIKMAPKDPMNPTSFELKHMPQITLGEKDEKGFTTVEITVGQKGIIHPSIDTHWIDYIELWADKKLVGRTELQPTISRGFDSYKVNLVGYKKLTAIAGCNLHGIWEDSITL